MLENKCTPERGCFEGKILSFIYPLLQSLCEAAASLLKWDQTKRPPCPIHLWGIWDGPMCMWILQGGDKTLNKPSLLPFCPWGFPVSGQPLCWGQECRFIPLCFWSPAWALQGTLNVQCLGKGLDLVQSQYVLKYLQAKESNNLSSYLKVAVIFLC